MEAAQPDATILEVVRRGDGLAHPSGAELLDPLVVIACDHHLVPVRQRAQLLIEVGQRGLPSPGAKGDVAGVAQDVARWDRHRVEL